MRVTLIYHHDSSDLTIEFLIEQGEQALGVGIGLTPQTSEKNLMWFKDAAEIKNKFYKVDKEKPYITLLKKKDDGKVLISAKPINVLKDWPPAPSNSITIKHYEW